MTLEALQHRNPLLLMLSDTELDVFESFSRRVEFAPDSILFEEDAPADVFYIVSTGRVGLEMTTPGKAPIVLQTLGAGQLVGVSWLFAPYRWGWRARALAPTVALAFDAQPIRDECAANRDLGYRVAAALAEEALKRLHGARLQLLDLYQSVGQ
jgi:CRP-like cAMP-binding protein